MKKIILLLLFFNSIILIAFGRASLNNNEIFLTNSSSNLAPEPTVKSSNTVVNNRLNTNINLSFTPGNGSNRLIILRLKGQPAPIVNDGIRYNAFSTQFGNSGALISPGNYLLSNTTGAAVNISNLERGQSYIMTVIEYNVFTPGQGTENYLTSNVFVDTISPLLASPTIPHTNFTVTTLSPYSLKLKWSKGNGNSTLVAALAGNTNFLFSPTDGVTYNSNSSFGNSTPYNTNHYVVYNGSADSVIITNLQPATYYSFRIYSLNDSVKKGHESYYRLTIVDNYGETLELEPTTIGSKLNFFNRTETSMKVNVPKGNGSGRLLIMKIGSPVNRLPIDGRVYNQGDTLGNGNRIVSKLASNFTSHNVTIPNLTANTTCYFAVIEYNDANAYGLPNYLTSIYVDSSNTTCLPSPTINAKFKEVINKTDSSITFRLTKGNGNKRLVQVSSDLTAGNQHPTDTAIYNTNTRFGQGHSFANLYYAIYSDTGTIVTVKNLQPKTQYKFRVYEFNDSTLYGYSNYLTLNPLTFNQNTTEVAPTRIATAVSYSNATIGSREIKIIGGNGKGKIVLASTRNGNLPTPKNGVKYHASNLFGNFIPNGQMSSNYLGDSTYVVFNRYPELNTTDSVFTLELLITQKKYYIRVFEYSGESKDFYHYTNTFLLDSTTTLNYEPTLQDTNVYLTQRGVNSVRVHWQKRSGEKSIVTFSRAGQADIPVDGITYKASGNLLLPQSIGNSKCVYIGNANNVLITGIKPDSAFSINIFSFNGANGTENYLTSSYGWTVNTTVASEPTNNTIRLNYLMNDNNNDLKINAIRGNGEKRLVVYSRTNRVSFVPKDTTEYPKSGAINTTDIVLSNDSSTNYTIRNIIREKMYYFKSYEYNGKSELSYNYRNNNAFEDSVMTLALSPILGSSGLNFKIGAGNSIRINLQKGDGKRRLVIARRALPVNKLPEDGVFYQSDADFGQGSNLGEDNYVVYSDTGNSFVVTNLLPNTNYHFRVVEYNGNNLTGKNCSNNYLNSSILNGNFNTIESEPNVSAKNINFSDIINGSATISWENGNGSGRIVIIRKDLSISRLPEDGNSNLNANTTLGFGTNLGEENYVVYNGIGNSVNVLGLDPEKVYYVTVIEYNGLSNNINYQENEFEVGNNLPVEPNLNSNNVNFITINKNNLKFSFTSGNGNFRIVIAKKNNVVNVLPIDGKNYIANSTFGMGESLGDGNYVVYIGNSNIIEVFGLEDSTTYHFGIVEFNEASIGPPNYLTSTCLRTAANTKFGFVGINGSASTEYKVYPNPVNSENVFVDFNNENVGEIELRDILGRKIEREIFTKNSISSINIVGLKGMYVLNIKTSKGIFNHKIIIP